MYEHSPEEALEAAVEAADENLAREARVNAWHEAYMAMVRSM